MTSPGYDPSQSGDSRQDDKALPPQSMPEHLSALEQPTAVLPEAHRSPTAHLHSTFVPTKLLFDFAREGRDAVDSVVKALADSDFSANAAEVLGLIDVSFRRLPPSRAVLSSLSELPGTFEISHDRTMTYVHKKALMVSFLTINSLERRHQDIDPIVTIRSYGDSRVTLMVDLEHGCDDPWRLVDSLVGVELTDALIYERELEKKAFLTVAPDVQAVLVPHVLLADPAASPGAIHQEAQKIDFEIDREHTIPDFVEYRDAETSDLQRGLAAMGCEPPRRILVELMQAVREDRAIDLELINRYQKDPLGCEISCLRTIPTGAAAGELPASGGIVTIRKIESAIAFEIMQSQSKAASEQDESNLVLHARALLGGPLEPEGPADVWSIYDQVNKAICNEPLPAEPGECTLDDNGMWQVTPDGRVAFSLLEVY